jgi:hypothetical protein
MALKAIALKKPALRCGCRIAGEKGKARYSESYLFSFSPYGKKEADRPDFRPSW